MLLNAFWRLEITDVGSTAGLANLDVSDLDVEQ